MKITIAQRLRPFCHLPGTSCVVPWSSWKVQAFPTLIRWENLVTGEKKEENLGWKGPVLDFTVELDLEKGCVFVFGHTQDGYQRKKIELREIEPHHVERLSLGSHKKLDWELVKRRRDLQEILPVWFRLGQMMPHVGTASVTPDLRAFLAGFEGILTPRLKDAEYQGIDFDFPSSPLALLTEGAKAIRSLFFQEKENTFSFLPALPPEFHAGRLLHIKTEMGDLIDIEWSKKLLRRVVITPKVTREVFLSLQKPLRSFRSEKKQLVDQPLLLEAGKKIELDRFEK